MEYWCPLLLLTSFLCHLTGCHEAGSLSLRSVHVFFRHGQRTPIKPYPTDPYSDLSYWPEGWSQITKVGKRETYELGKRIRSIYHGFIPKEFRDDDVYVYSTDQSRAIMSAQTFLAGLYPPDKHQRWLKHMPWQPVPVHTRSAYDDPLYPVSACEVALTEFTRVQALPEVQRVIDQDVIGYLKKHAGETKSLEFLPYYLLIYDILKVQEEHNLPLPEWSKAVYPDKLKVMAIFVYKIFVYTPLLKRLRAGPLIEQVTTGFQRHRNRTISPPSRKLFIYSVHDFSIMSLAQALDLFEPHSLPYGVAMMFELHELSDGHFGVKIRYLNGTNSDPQVLVMPGCTDMCLLDDFLSIALRLVPSDWKTECLKTSSDSVCLLGSHILMFILMVCFCWKW